MSDLEAIPADSTPTATAPVLERRIGLRSAVLFNML